MTETVNKFVHLIPVARVIVVNPRIRSKKSFKELVENIAALGLKKPITVTLREESDGPAYDLVCGQGRLNAQPDRSVVIGAPPVGYNDHFWPTKRGTYAAGSVNGVYVQMDIRTNDPNMSF